MQDQTVPYISWQACENILAEEIFYLQGKLNDINEQDTSFLDCKHKHMSINGAPPDRFGVLNCLPHLVFHGFTAGLMFKGYHSGSWSYLNFLETVWVPLRSNGRCSSLRPYYVYGCVVLWC